MTNAGAETSRGMVWDHEDCPEDGCDGELQQQDRYNVMCLSCESVWGHAKMGDKHYLQTADFETVATKPIAMADGGTSTSDTERSDDPYNGAPSCDDHDRYQPGCFDCEVKDLKEADL